MLLFHNAIHLKSKLILDLVLSISWYPIILCRLAQLQFIYFFLFIVLLFICASFYLSFVNFRPFNWFYDLSLCASGIFFFGFLFRFWKYGIHRLTIYVCQKCQFVRIVLKSFDFYEQQSIFQWNFDAHKKRQICLFSFRWFSHTLDQNIYAWNIIKWAILLLNHIELNIFHGMKKHNVRRLESDGEWSI